METPQSPEAPKLAAGYTACDVAVGMPYVMVIFGASGGLSHTKLLPSLFRLDKQKLLPERFSVIGFARTKMDGDAFRKGVAEAIAKDEGGRPDKQHWARFAARLHYMSGEYNSPDALAALSKLIGDIENRTGLHRRLFYMALPPTVAETVLKTMKQVRFVEKGARPESAARILMEKPFGLDLESARRVDALLSEMFDEPQIYRVDHYLGKDTVRNILLFRFANSIWEPLWNNHYIEAIFVTAAEDFGVEGRGGYYDEAGVVRDVVQNHVLQLVSLIAMEPPLAGDPESVADRKIEIFKSLAEIKEGDFILGQYEGYRKQKGIAPDSRTPTFVAVKMHLQNWRWHGVPIYIRAGKGLARRVTEAVIEFRQVPLCVITDQRLCSEVKRNRLVLRIQPEEGVRLTFTAKVPGHWDQAGQATMDFRYTQFGIDIPEAYERILLDSFCEVPTLFARADAVEAEWRAVAPMIEWPSDEIAKSFPNYKTGTWGPAQAEELVRRDGFEWPEPY